jgi:hypothetical protein
MTHFLWEGNRENRAPLNERRIGANLGERRLEGMCQPLIRAETLDGVYSGRAGCR